MFFRILKNELKRKRTMNVILFLFIMMATMFLASSVSNLITVNGAVDYFFEISNTPNYLINALAEEDKDEIADYLENSELITEYGVTKGFGVTDEQVSIVKARDKAAKKYEKTSVLCVQAVPEDFMKVFDENDEPLQLKQGEIAFPRLEATENHLAVGDKVKLKIGEIEQEFTIKTLTKDAVFGSAMMGLKRLIINEKDFQRFANQTGLTYTNLYAINFDDKDAFVNAFQKENFNVLSNVDEKILPVCYVFDMLIAGLLIIVSVCLILIAFMVLRFTIVFTLQEDYKEIGIMKAIGLKNAGIKGVYLVKYLAIAVFASVLGAIASFPFGNMLLQQSIVNMVVNDLGQNVLLHILCAVVIVGIVLLFSNSCANKLKKFSAIDAIRNGSNGERYTVKSRMRLSKRKSMKPGFYMACNDILSSPKRFLVLMLTFCIGALLILLPLHALHTLTSANIASQFSMASSDVYINNGKSDKYVEKKSLSYIEEDLDKLEKELNKNGIHAQTGTDVAYIIPCYSNDKEKMFSYFTLQEMGSWERSYEVLEGREPEAEDEIMVTRITAKEMDVTIGDTITYQCGEKPKEFIITGIYESMINMGQGFRVSRAATLDENYISGIFCLQAEVPDMTSDEACEKISDIFPEYKVMNAPGFINDMTGGIADTLQLVMYLITGVVLIINSMITALMMKTLMEKDRGSIALLKSIGFSNRSIRKWQVQRVMIILVFAIILGTVLSRLLAPVTIGPIFAMMGAEQITLVVKPLEAYLIYPLILLLVTGCTALLCSLSIKSVDAKEINNIE